MRLTGQVGRPAALVAVTALLGVLLGSGLVPPPARGQAPKQGGTVRVALHLEPTTLDPQGPIHATGVKYDA